MLDRYALSLIEEALLADLPATEASQMSLVGLLCRAMENSLLREELIAIPKRWNCDSANPLLLRFSPWQLL